MSNQNPFFFVSSLSLSLSLSCLGCNEYVESGRKMGKMGNFGILERRSNTSLMIQYTMINEKMY